ncbi:hypothetical protein ACFXKG_18420 [Streptomyces sp. NPDC059255]|uniref:hypothetical protein n=1 Tax=Streptomyces sp. NPDC059255 TaxID=3346793 RepID=UPI0036B3C25E
MSAEPGADERRVQHLLRRRGVGPNGDPAPVPPPRPARPPRMPAPRPDRGDWVDEAVAASRAQRPRPITPTRIIPPGTPLPLPERVPEHGEVPPQRPAPPAAAPPAVPPPLPPNGWYGPGPYAGPPVPAGPIEVHVTLTPAAPAPDPTWRERIMEWLRTYASPTQAILGLVLAVAPIPGVGYSAAAVWYETVAGARDFGSGWGYALGGTALVLTAAGLARRRSLTGGKTSSFLRIFFFATALVGSFGAINLYDPVTWITGVTP